jgi:hypothetical protein
MFNDRDLGILGAGALLAVLCLVLSLPFTGKVVLAAFVLVGFIVLALLRLGPDRIPPEVWLWRRIRFHMRPRRYTYQQPGYTPPGRRRIGRSWRSFWRRLVGRRRRGERHQDTPGPEQRAAPASRFRPVGLALDEIDVYLLATVLLGVVGTYFIAYLAQGGAEEIALLIGGLFP